MATDPADAVSTVVGLGHTLRAAGIDVGTDRLREMVRALSTLDPADRTNVYWAGRLTLCATEEDLRRFDRVFEAYFSGRTPRLRPRTIVQREVTMALSTEGERPGGDGQGKDRSPVVAAAASPREILRHRDFASLSTSERQELHALLNAFRLPAESRPSRRFQAATRGRVDQARSVRELLHAGGEPGRLRYRVHRRRPRRVVLLVDVSGSMNVYALSLLRFAHAAARQRRANTSAQTEVFTIGTRLTRVTREMCHRDPDAAMAALAASVPDWSGGTRLGGLLKEFLDRWGQRGLARGAVVVILSDGWERGEVGLLADQMERLSRLAHRVVWSNPLKARPGYAPLAAGMAAALPWVDDFVEGHSLAALERLAAVVTGDR